MHPNGTVSRTCETCGATFSAKPYRVRDGHARFCSVACFAKTPHDWVGPQPDPAKKHDVTCAVCGATFRSYAASPGRSERRYCGNACAHEGQRIGRAERFWAKVDKNGPVPERYPDLGPCWLWTGSRFRNGYGQCTRNLIASGLAHRAAWELTNGPIPDGLFVLHACDNPPCCNPSHLSLGTRSDNSQDMVIKNRRDYARELTADQVRAIRAEYVPDHGMQTTLASKYGVSPMTIYDIVHRRTWKRF